MRKLIESTLVSLDGVIEAPERWATFDAEATSLSLEQLGNYDAFVMGRVLSLSDFIDHYFTLGRPMSNHERVLGAAFFEEPRQHAIGRFVESDQSGGTAASN